MNLDSEIEKMTTFSTRLSQVQAEIIEEMQEWLGELAGQKILVEQASQFLEHLRELIRRSGHRLFNEGKQVTMALAKSDRSTHASFKLQYYDEGKKIDLPSSVNFPKLSLVANK